MPGTPAMFDVVIPTRRLGAGRPRVVAHEMQALFADDERSAMEDSSHQDWGRKSRGRRADAMGRTAANSRPATTAGSSAIRSRWPSWLQ